MLPKDAILWMLTSAPFVAGVGKPEPAEQKPSKEDLAEAMRKVEAARLKRERKNATRWANHQKSIQQQKGEE